MEKYDKYIPIKDFKANAYPDHQKVFFNLKGYESTFTGFLFFKNSRYFVRMVFSGNDYDIAGDRVTFIMAVSRESVRQLQPLLFNW